MSLTSSRTVLLRSALFVAFAASTFFLGGTKAEAAATSTVWYYSQTLPACTMVDLRPTPSTYDCGQNTCTGPWDGTYQIYLGTDVNGYVSWGPYTVPSGYTVQAVTTGGDAQVTNYYLCGPPYTQNNLATFGAGLDSSAGTYAPGTFVHLKVAAASGDQGNSVGGWLTGGVLGSILNSIWCIFFGCSSPPGVSVMATMTDSGVTYLSDSVGGSGTASGTFTFAAPTTPGTYTINLTGYYYNSSQFSTSFLTFTVVAPPGGPAPLTAACSVSPTAAAIGQSVNWNAVASGGTPPYTYTFTGTNFSGIASAATNATTYTMTNSYPTTGTKNGTISVTDSNVGPSTSYSYLYNGGECTGAALSYPGATIYDTEDGGTAAGAWNLAKHFAQSLIESVPNQQNYCADYKVTVRTCHNCIPLYDIVARLHATNGFNPALPAYKNVTAKSVPVPNPATVTAACTNSVMVGSNTPPTTTFTVSPSPVPYGGTTTITWSSTNATSCTAGGPWSNLTSPLSGTTVSSTLTADATFTFQCTGPGGTSPVQSVTVPVGPPTTSSCPLPWGGTIANGSSVTAYQSSTVVPPASCVSQARTCTNGVLSGTYTNKTCAVGQPAPTVTLTASPNPIANGGRSTLTWSSTDATSCTAGGPWSTSGQLSGSGLTDPLTTDTTFTLQCTGPGGTSPVQSVTITVGAPSACPLPWGGGLPSGSSVTAYQASTVVAPASCVPETRTCTNGELNGTYTNKTCAVVEPPTVTFSSSPNPIDPGQSTKLTWSSTNATSCTGTGFSTGGATSNASGVAVAPLTTTAYQITCTGPGGPTTKTITVTVNQPQVSITASPSRVRSGDTTTLTWSSSGVLGCTETGPGLASTTKNGSQSVVITGQSTFAITCTTHGMPVSSTTVVNLVPLFQEF